MVASTYCTLGLDIIAGVCEPFSPGQGRAGNDSVRVRRATLEIPLAMKPVFFDPQGLTQSTFGKGAAQRTVVGSGLRTNRSFTFMLWREESKQALASKTLLQHLSPGTKSVPTAPFSLQFFPLNAIPKFKTMWKQQPHMKVKSYLPDLLWCLLRIYQLSIYAG